MNFEIRDGRLHLAGYVNAVERDSKVIMTARGRCVEQVAAGAFAASMADGHEIRMMLDHKRNIGTTTDGTLSLKEDNIGLYAEASTDDEELMALAGRGELRGWSFGFVAKDDEIEERSGKEPRRRVKALDLQEVSILSVMPAYNGTSIECRSYDECALPEDVESIDDGAVEDVETVDTSAVDELRAYAAMMKMKGYMLRKREEQRALETRYNHYHNPVNGQFASGKGGGAGLRYSFGKGKGSEIVGASSPWSAPKKPSLTYEEYEKKLNDINKRSKKLYDERKKATKSLSGDERMRVWDEYTGKILETGKEAEALKRSVPKEYLGIATTIDTFGGTGKQAALLMPDGTYKTAGDTTTYINAQKRFDRQFDSWFGHG